MIMNEDKMIIGVFQSEAELIAKINELTLNGYSEDDMYVITKDNDGISDASSPYRCRSAVGKPLME